MYTVALKEAEGRLAALLDEVAKGQEVVITREDGATFKIVPSSSRTARTNDCSVPPASGKWPSKSVWGGSRCLSHSRP